MARTIISIEQAREVASPGYGTLATVAGIKLDALCVEALREVQEGQAHYVIAAEAVAYGVRGVIANAVRDRKGGEESGLVIYEVGPMRPDAPARSSRIEVGYWVTAAGAVHMSALASRSIRNRSANGGYVVKAGGGLCRAYPELTTQPTEVVWRKMGRETREMYEAVSEEPLDAGLRGILKDAITDDGGISAGDRANLLEKQDVALAMIALIDAADVPAATPEAAPDAVPDETINAVMGG